MIKTTFLGGVGADRRKNRNELKKIKTRLKSRNEANKEKLNALNDELKFMNNAITKANKDIDSCEQRIKTYPQSNKIKILEAKNETLTTEINIIRQNIKNLKSDEESTLLLIDTMHDDYDELKNDKLELSKRVKALQLVLEELNIEKQQNLPQLKEYDSMLKKAWHEMHETENSMDISLKLWQKKSNYKSVAK